MKNSDKQNSDFHTTYNNVIEPQIASRFHPMEIYRKSKIVYPNKKLFSQIFKKYLANVCVEFLDYKMKLRLLMNINALFLPI